MTLDTSDIGEERKAALHAEARRKGIPVSALVRHFIDEGMERASHDWSKEEWIEAARPGFEAEAKHLEEHGPLLARFLPGYHSEDEK